MALWKPFRGSRDNLDTVDKHDGYIYFCIDDGSLFFDYTDASGVLQRKQITVQEAEKLLTPMNVTIGKKTVSVDGSKDVSFPLYEIMGSVETPSSGSSNKSKWVKFANINLPSAWGVCSGILNFTKTEGSYGAEGILSYYFRNGSSTSTTDISLSWISLNNENWAESVAAVKVSDGNFDLYYKPVKDYETVLITAINIYNPSRLTFGTGSYTSTITAEEVSSVHSYAEKATKDGSGNVITSTYETKTDASSKLALINDHLADKENPHEVTKAQIGLGNVDNTADADKNVKAATNDSKGQNIADTYIKSLSVSGQTITYTKGDGDTGTITTQDTNTTYSVATSSVAGLMSASDKAKLDGIASGANAYVLPAATASTLGGVKVSYNDGVLTITTS